MPIESATFINQLVLTNPTSADKKNTSDDHLRLMKVVIKSSFSNLNNVVSASASEMNQLVGVTSNLQTQINTTKGFYVDLTSGASTAVNAVLWDGSTKYISTASASGVGSNGDFWFQYE